METPLLASDEGNTPPSLSSGPVVENEESGLSLLMAGPPPEEPSQPPSSPRVSPVERALCTVAAGTLALAQAGFVWGSYLSSSWSETLVVFTASWLQNIPFSEEFVRDFSDTVAQSWDLGSTLSMFGKAHQYALLGLLIVTTLVLPCLAMVVHPTFIVSDWQTSKYSIDDETSARSTWRTWLELTIRTSMCVVYVLAVLDLCTSSIELDWTGTSIQIHNRLQGGLVSYVVGITAAMLLVVILRIRRYRWRDKQSAESSLQTGYVLLDEETDNAPSLRNGKSTPVDASNGRRRSFLHRILAWEFGLVAILLWVPTLTLPLFEVTYSGLAAPFMESTSLKVYLGEMAMRAWHNGASAGTDTWMLLICIGTSILHLTLVPLIALALCVGVWMGSRRCKRLLYCIHPNANGITFCVALILTVHALQPIGQYLLDDFGLCQKIDNLIGETCLSFSGTVLWGTWSCLGAAIALELFVLTTLWGFP